MEDDETYGRNICLNWIGVDYLRNHMIEDRGD